MGFNNRIKGLFSNFIGMLFTIILGGFLEKIVEKKK